MPFPLKFLATPLHTKRNGQDKITDCQLTILAISASILCQIRNCLRGEGFVKHYISLAKLKNLKCMRFKIRFCLVLSGDIIGPISKKNLKSRPNVFCTAIENNKPVCQSE